MSIYREEAATLGAGVGEGLETGGKLAIGVVATAVEGALLFAYLLHQLAPTFRTANAKLNLEGLGMFALRVATTGEEPTVAPGFDYHRLTALRANFLG